MGSKQTTARSANAKIQITRKWINQNQRAVPRSTKETAIATTKTTTQAVCATMATAVLKPSRVERSKKITAKCAHAKIPKANDAGRCACENDVFFFSLFDIQTDTRRVSSVEYILGDW